VPHIGGEQSSGMCYYFQTKNTKIEYNRTNVVILNLLILGQNT